MRKVLAVFLLFAVLIGSMTNALIYLHYEIYKTHYALVLCENKDKPQLHCNGHCHLKQELKNEAKRSSEPSNRVNEEREIIFFNESVSIALPELVTAEITPTAISTRSTFSEAHLLSVFRPPQV